MPFLLKDPNTSTLNLLQKMPFLCYYTKSSPKASNSNPVKARLALSSYSS